MNHIDKAAAMLAVEMFTQGYLPLTTHTPEPKPKPMIRCGLPGCTLESTKDYCSAEHCRQHRARQRAARQHKGDACHDN